MASRRRLAATFVATAAALALAACSSATSTTSSTGSAPGQGGSAVGFIFVGPKTDFGYNQAAYEGSQEVAKKFPDLKVLTQENVPEDDNAARVMEGMIGRGAKIIFATSYGHLQAAEKVAAAHPDVVVVQQGNVITGTVGKNIGTYFGTVYEPVYLAGVAAGKATKSNKLGYVYAFPIPQTINNINAFELGAQSVNPKAKTYAVNTGSWCDPQKQKTAVDSLLSQKIDVVTQHQDCTSTVITATEAAGAYTVGYHADASSLAPKGWLTGSQWKWGPLYDDIVQTAIDGKFTGSKYNANYRVGLQNGENPFVQSPYGPSVTDETKAIIADDLTKLKADGASVFTGPIKGQDGKVKIKEGESLQYGDPGIEGMDWFVDGVVGKIAK
ncbi:BMP family ABC transporter substrate-binding protein [Spongisporangium articulatum]|uniref:BMP family ABC transporter substrate-binding protein n=1 Tax=Spongisporangium articulatum TaxID=3362603 RepID=A0ABW8AJU7_9ACTN